MQSVSLPIIIRVFSFQQIEYFRKCGINCHANYISPNRNSNLALFNDDVPFWSARQHGRKHPHRKVDREMHMSMMKKHPHF